MLHLLNKNLNLQLVILILLIGWSVWNIFARMTLMPAEGAMFLYHPVAKLWTWSPVVVRTLTLLIVLTMTYGVMKIFQQNHFYDNRTYMPGVFLLLMLNFGKFLDTFSPALLTTFFIALNMILYFPNESASRAKDRIFTFGLAISIATMLDISAFGIFLFLLLTIAINNITPFKDNVILFIGLLFPYLYAFSFAFLFDSMPAFLQSWRDITLFVPAKEIPHLRIVDYITLSYFCLIVVYLIIRGKRLLDNKLIVIRQAFTNIHLLFISMLVFMWLGNMSMHGALLYLLMPISIYLSVAVVPKRQRFVFDILLVAFCVLLWL